MPRGRTNIAVSNLSILIPRDIHNRARAKAVRSNAPSFAAYVASVLESAPAAMSPEQWERTQMIELKIIANLRRKS